MDRLRDVQLPQRVFIRRTSSWFTDLPSLFVPLKQLVHQVQPVQAAPQAQLEPGDDNPVRYAV